MRSDSDSRVDDGAADVACVLAHLELCQATKLGHSTEFQLVNPAFTLGRLPAFQDNIARVRPQLG